MAKSIMANKTIGAVIVADNFVQDPQNKIIDQTTKNPDRQTAVKDSFSWNCR